MYRQIIRPILFLFSPESIHRFGLKLLRFLGITGLGKWLLKRIYSYHDPLLEREVFGIRFPNPVGVAPGFDTDARCYRELGALGFGFVETGTITPKRQPGNMKPRLFRLPEDKALVSRTGFDNGGVETALDHLRSRSRKPGVIVGANIAKNTLTSVESAANDFLRIFRSLYEYVDYFVVNIGDPGVSDPSPLRSHDEIRTVLNELFEFRRGQNQYRPVLLKLSIDWPLSLIDDLIDILIGTPLDGVVVGGATVARSGLQTPEKTLLQIGFGGLSGPLLLPRTLKLIDYVSHKTEGRYPVIASGGVSSPEDVQRLLDAGASLVEIYTGIVYNGPGFAKHICKHLAATAHQRIASATKEEETSHRDSQQQEKESTSDESGPSSTTRQTDE